MLFKKINKIKLILGKRNSVYLLYYFLFSSFVVLLEAIGIGLIPVIFSGLMDQSLILNKLDFNETVYNFVYNVFNNKNFFLLIPIIIFLFFLIKTSINVIFIFFESKFFKLIMVNLTTNVFEIYLKKNYLFHALNNPLILGRNITAEVNNTISHIRNFLLIFRESFQVIIIGMVLLFAHFKVTILIFLIIVFFGIIFFYLTVNKLKQKEKISFFERGEKSKIINQIINSIIEVKLYQKAIFFIEKYKKSTNNELDSNYFQQIISKLPKQIIEFIIVFVLSLSIFYASFQGLKIEAMIALILLYFFAALKIYPSINNLLINRLGLIKTGISFDVIHKTIKNKNEDSESIKITNKFDFQDKIKLVNVNFSYQGRNKSLKDINLEVKKNEMIGLVGKTGSGKSTLIKIIMGLITPHSGEFTVDGKNIENIKYKWQKNISYIPQNFFILDDTIKKNIIFGENENDINYNLLEKSIKFSSLDAFISQLPKKLDTFVGANGRKISGGQAQRLIIARAIYKNTDLIILDEATNSLDKKTELEIMENIYKLKGKKTIFLITHNQKILNGCDKIFDISDGNLVKK